MRLRGIGPATLAGISLASAVALGSALAKAPTAGPWPAPPQVLFRDLFATVQTQAIYDDGKFFADAVPNSTPDEILRLYHGEHPQTPQEVKRFVDAHFTFPPQATAPPSVPDRVPIEKHIDLLWDELTRHTPTVPPYSSALPLPAAYVVPGGRFREIYYWDSYFTMLGLADSGREDLIKSMVSDFAWLLDQYGHVPNGARTYYLSRSQPPFFFAMLGLESPGDPAAAYAQFLPQLEREYAFWMEGAAHVKPGTAHRRVVAMPDGSVLNRYWDDRDTPRDEAFRQDVELAHSSSRPAREVFRDIRAAAESGWDFSSRWFADRRTRATIETTQVVPVDLNSLLFGLETALAAGCERAALQNCSRDFRRRSESRRKAIDRYLWNAKAGAYLDYRWKQREPANGVSAATLYPLFFGVASQKQADLTARTVVAQLLRPAGVVTTPLSTGEQWDAPNGWAPLQWIAIQGLRQYANQRVAEIIACRWMVNVQAVYRQSGKLVEKYDVVTAGRSGGGGEYPSQDGFGWTNGVTRRLMTLYPGDAAFTELSQCPGE